MKQQPSHLGKDHDNDILFSGITAELLERGWDASSNAGIVTIRTQANVEVQFERGPDYWTGSLCPHGTTCMNDQLAIPSTCQDVQKIVDAMLASINDGEPTASFGDRVTMELQQLGIGASWEHPGAIHISLSGKSGLVCGTVNEYWDCDLHNDMEAGDLAKSFRLSVRSDDERNPEQVAKEIQALVKRLNGETPLSKPWRVQADPQHVGDHPYHNYRFITTMDFDFEAVTNTGSIICAMRDLPSIREVASHIVATHNATLVKDSPTGESTRETRLLETATDIAYIAGGFRYYSGDSRADITQFIEWARAFEAIGYKEEEYMERVEGFALARLNDAGYTELNSPIRLIADLADNLCKARNEDDDESKLAMVDGGCAHELLERANRILPESMQVKCND